MKNLMVMLTVIGIALMSMGGPAWAEKVPCDINGRKQEVKSEAECRALGGNVVHEPAADAAMTR